MNSSATTNKRLEGKVAIITGGARGIGASAVQIFHQNGAKIVVGDIQDDLGQALAKKLGENVSYVHCDVSNENDMRNLIDTTISQHGKLDIMYNNAGVLDKPLGGILEAEKTDLEKVININLVGAFLGAKHASRVMIPQQKGSIIFTASACTLIGGISFSHPYAASKHAVVGFAKNLAAEVGQYGIRVNSVSPFGVATAMVGVRSEDGRSQMEFAISQMGNLKGGILKAEDVAMAALFLASDEANYVSGLNLVVDGGFSIVNPTMMRAKI
ncbi:hypothetical protein UlMin_005451 [Ulmus minor]